MGFCNPYSLSRKHGGLLVHWGRNDRQGQGYCAELKQFDFRRGAAEARGVKLRFALAQEGCSTACLDGEVDVWHGQSAHSSLRSSLPS